MIEIAEKERSYTREDTEKVASALCPVLGFVDNILLDYKIETLKEMAENLQDHASTAMSGSILLPDGLERAEDAQDRANVFEAFVNIMEVRDTQRKNVIKRNETAGARDNVGKALGLF